MANELLARLDPITGRLAPGGTALHDDLDGLTHHAPSALGQGAGLMPQTNGDGTYTLVPTPALDPTEAAGRTLGVTHAKPATQTDYAPQTTTGTYDPIFNVTFTAPASGRVTLDVDTTLIATASAPTLRIYEGGTILAEKRIDNAGTAASLHVTFLLSDLSSGNHTVTLGGSNLSVRVGPVYPTLLVVRDAPF